MYPKDQAVTVRRRWNDPSSAKTSARELREVRVRSDPGGVCGPLDRPFLFAKVWCDHLSEGETLHRCTAATAPHELEICILEQDNDAALYAQLLNRSGRTR